MMSTPIYRLYEGRLHPVDKTDGDLLVADSWLVSNGRARGLPHHRARFYLGCNKLSDIKSDELEAIWSQWPQYIPQQDDWFPRIEVRRTQGRDLLFFRVRRAPVRRNVTSLCIWPKADKRRYPQIKGPDFAFLDEVRSFARQQGTDEALLVDESGNIIECGYSSIVWWQSDTLHTPVEQRALPSVTKALILERAFQKSIQTTSTSCPPQALIGKEVWIINALHGITSASRIEELELLGAPNRERLSEWRQHLASKMQPIVPRSIPSVQITSD